jgi:hypothetical protein
MPNDQVHASQKRTVMWLKTGTLVVGLALVAGCSASSGSSGSAGGASSAQLSAFDVCQSFVKDQLKAPGTASFRDPFGDQAPTFDGDGKGPITVSSSVDSENSFGAKLRAPFVCTVSNTGGDNWHLDSINVDDSSDG